MKKNVLVTVVVPIYNVEKYVRKCLDSLLQQTYKDFEIWAVIDGSPDNSVQIVQEFEKIDDRVKCIEKENGGYGSVLEYATRNIKTKYFVICDPDDWLESNALEILVNKAEAYDLDILVGDKHIIYENGTIDYEKLNDKYYELVAGKLYDKDVEKFAFMHPSPHAKLFKTDITREIVFPHKISYTDFVLFEISLKNAKRIMYIDDKLAFYLVDRAGNTRIDKSPKAIKAHLMVWDSVFSQIDKTDKIIIYRLYMELKVIMSVYYKNSLKLFDDDLFDLIKNDINKLILYKDDIENSFTLTRRDKIELGMIFGSNFALKSYIRLRKILGR